MSKLIFIKSATLLKECPIDAVPEVAFVGRSNAGKSSIINALAGSKVAKVSQSPGKTRLLNFFKHKEGYRVVDMPGYGYASRSGDEVKSWRKMIEAFLFKRENLRVLLLIMDIRRDWSEEEQMILDLCEQRNLQFGLIINKSDKLSNSAVIQKKNQLLQQLNLEYCLPFSCLKKVGTKDLEKSIFDWLRP